jgi:hypothetical protein
MQPCLVLSVDLVFVAEDPLAVGVQRIHDGFDWQSWSEKLAHIKDRVERGERPALILKWLPVEWTTDGASQERNPYSPYDYRLPHPSHNIKV